MEYLYVAIDKDDLEINRNTFPLKFFSCCFNEPEEELEISDLDSHTGNTYMNTETVNGVKSLFPSKYIRKEEKNLLKFDKPNLIRFFNELIELIKNPVQNQLLFPRLCSRAHCL